MAPPRDSPVRSSWPSITLLPWPLLHPVQHKPVSIPRAVCAWYKPDRRRSGRGSEFPGLLSCSNPRAGRRVSLCAGCAAEAAPWQWWLWQWWAVAAAGVAVASTWPCGGSALVSPACLGPWHAGGRRTKPGGGRAPACHAALPLSHHAAAGGTRVKFKESQQRQLLGLPSTGITVSPSPASSCPSPGPHLPGSMSSSSLPSGLCCAPGSPAPLCTQQGFLI